MTRILLCLALCLAGGPAAALEFAPYETLALPDADSMAQAVAVGDVTGDGRNDVVLTSMEAGKSFSVWIFTQQADGTLQRTPVRHAFPTAPSTAYRAGVALADLDGDGVQDILLGTSRGLTVMRGGTLVGGQEPSMQDVPSLICGLQVAAADINRDGAMDVVGHCLYPYAVIYFGDGQGGFLGIDYAYTHATGVTNDMEIADLNSDGWPDLAVTGEAGAGRLNITYSNPPYGFTTLPVQLYPRYLPTGTAVGDFNHDGRIDAVTGQHANRGESDFSSALSVYLQQANGRFTQPLPRMATWDLPNAMLGTDLDGDGRDDLVVDHGGWQLGYYLQGEAGLGEEVLVPVPGSGGRAHSQGVAVGDINGDGRKDFVLANYWYDLVVVHAQAPAPVQATPQRSVRARSR
jgi:hypothetical protein